MKRRRKKILLPIVLLFLLSACYAQEQLPNQQESFEVSKEKVASKVNVLLVLSYKKPAWMPWLFDKIQMVVIRQLNVYQWHEIERYVQKEFPGVYTFQYVNLGSLKFKTKGEEKDLESQKR